MRCFGRALCGLAIACACAFLPGCYVPGPLSVTPGGASFCSETRLDLRQIAARKNDFKQAPAGEVGASRGQDCWFRIDSFSLPPTGRTDATTGFLLMEVGIIKSRTVDVYIGSLPARHTRAVVTPANRLVAHRFFVFEIPVPDGVVPPLLIHASTAVPDLGVAFWTAPAFHESAQREHYLLGIFIGVVLIMGAYNLVLGVALKDRMYAYYVIYTISVGVFMLGEDGLLHHWLQLSLLAGKRTFVLVMALFSGSALLFARSYLETERSSLLLGRAMFRYALFSLTVVPAVALLLIEKRGVLMNMSGAVVLILVIAAIVHGLRRKHVQAFTLAIAASLFVASITGRLLWLLDVRVASNFLLQHGAKFGAALELAILSLGLAARYNRLQADFVRTKAQHARERERLIGEVHDTIGARLSAALLHLGRDTVHVRLAAILQSALDQARDLTALIQSAGRPGVTFESEVRGLVDTYSGLPGMRIDLDLTPRFNSLDLKQRIHVTRLLQEWLSNTVRHGGARRFRLEFRLRGDRAAVRVLSNGRGFSWRSDRAYAGPGSGLRGMAARTEHLAGRARSLDRARGSGRTGVAGSMESGSAFVLRFRLLGTQS